VNKNRSLMLCALGGLGLIAAFSLASGLAVPGPAAAASLPKFITLSVDQKLLSVSWNCGGGDCRPWFLTRVMTRADRAETYVLTVRHAEDVITEYVVSETRDGPAWPRPETEIFLTLPIDQRLESFGWTCSAQGCRLSVLTRTMGPKEEADAYLFTDGKTEYYIRETRE